MVETIIKLALESGVKAAQYLPGSAVVTDPVFRKICAGNACGKYGRCYMCPPFIGPIDELIDKVKQYSHAVLYQTVGTLENSFDYESMMEAGYNHNLCSQRLRKKLEGLLPGHLHLTGGGCHLCERCAQLEDAPCRHPEEALTSLEGYGIDVYRTSKATDLKYINGENTVTYFGIVLFD